jgi:hypothetical protein
MAGGWFGNHTALITPSNLVRLQDPLPQVVWLVIGQRPQWVSGIMVVQEIEDLHMVVQFHPHP